MSRIGKKPILIPEGVEVKIEENKLMVQGPKGQLSKDLRPEIKVEVKDKNIIILPKEETKLAKALWGTTRAIIANMIKGVTEGYEKKLEIEGLGFKAQLSGENLILSLGFSHPVEVRAPSGIKFLVEKNIITVSGIDKELVGQTAASIRKLKLPEPYKGKGIKYLGERVRRKMGKKAVVGGK